MNNKAIAIFARPSFSDFFHALAGRMGCGGVIELSEFRRISASPLIGRFYHHLEKGTGSSLTEAEIHDVVRRDRVLRNIAPEQAGSWVRAMERALEDVLDQHGMDLVLSVPVDNYIRHLFRIKTAQRRIPHLAFGDVFIRGYCRLYHRNEHMPRRAVPDDEVRDVMRMLSDDSYRIVSTLPASLTHKYSAYNHLRRHLIFRAKQVVYHWRRMKECDPCNWEYHSVHAARDRRNALAFLGTRYFDRDWRKAQRLTQHPTVYVPLHVYPEGTLDYWVENPELLDYEDLVVRAVVGLHRHALVLLKEHPGMMGCRDPGLYRRLVRHPNVHIVPQDVSSNELIRVSDAVFTWSGSVGLEAALRGKLVAVVERPYYVDAQPCWHSIQEAAALDTLGETLARLVNRGTPFSSRVDQFEMLRNVLGACIPARFEEPGYKDPANVEKLGDLLLRVLDRDVQYVG